MTEVTVMYEYKHGGNAAYEDGKGSVIDLSANINPLGMPKGVREAIINEIPNCGSYPDSFSRKLREKIGAFENVKPDWIFCGNGASDIIFRLPRAVRAKKAMVTAPTFSDYERAVRSFGAEVVYHTLSADNDFALDGTFIEAVWDKKPDLIIICNPNNPTGNLTKPMVIKEILEYCKKASAWVVVDECFLDFSEKASEYTSKVFLENYSNLVILKAFTKLFALPGIRLGYALSANKKLIENLYFHGADWSVSNVAQAAGIEALSDAENYIEKTVKYISAERWRMEKELAQLGFKVFKAHANYVFFQNLYQFDLSERMDEKGIRIRSCGNYRELDKSFYRMAVSTKENNNNALTAIAEIINVFTKEKFHGHKSNN
jgi:threonine-phosphate decarboxylase